MGIYPRALARLFGYVPVILGFAAALTAVARAAPDDKPAAPSKAPLTVEQPTGQLPNAYKLNMLIRTTLIALNQANQTGNYSVLRDLGTPQFQSLNSDARLAEIFAALRNRKLDLSPLLFFDPKLIREPAMRPGGLLRLTGYIPTDPERILFDMGFERVGDQWCLSPSSSTCRLRRRNPRLQSNPIKAFCRRRMRSQRRRMQRRGSTRKRIRLTIRCYCVVTWLRLTLAFQHFLIECRALNITG